MTARPTTGVRYVLERARVEPGQVVYEGFAHRPADDVPLVVRVALPGGSVTASPASPAGAEPEGAPELARVASALVRAATKAEVAAGQELPRKIARWRA